MTNNFRYQFSRFLIGGVVAVTLDWITYFLFIRLENFDPSISKAFGFIVGTIFAFFYNGIISFGSNLSKIKFLRHITLYMFSMIINIGIFHIAMKTTPRFLGLKPLLSLSLATTISMMINFLGMRSWVFDKNKVAK
jgi:putative flippase GtrA